MKNLNRQLQGAQVEVLPIAMSTYTTMMKMKMMTRLWIVLMETPDMIVVVVDNETKHQSEQQKNAEFGLKDARNETTALTLSRSDLMTR
jgi:hypothetical protein